MWTEKSSPKGFTQPISQENEPKAMFDWLQESEENVDRKVQPQKSL